MNSPLDTRVSNTVSNTMNKNQNQNQKAKKATPNRPKQGQRRRNAQPLNRTQAGGGGSIPLNPSNQLAAGYAVGQRSANPRIKSTGGVSTRIVHREMFAKQSMTVAFTATKFEINPGLPGTFPWLSGQASGWETYRFNSLRFKYYTRVGSNVGGSIALSPDYDATDPAPTSEMEASENVGTQEDVSWKNILCELLPEGMHALGPKKFVRTGPLSANQDLKTYDAGNLFAISADGTAGPAGNLWVEYDITLSNPQSRGGPGGPYQRLYSGTATATSANPFGVPVLDSSLATYGSVTGNTFTFSTAGRFIMDYYARAATSATMVASVIGGGAVTVDYGTGTVGTGTTQAEDVRIIDAIVGSTIQYPITLVGATFADFNITPIGVKNPY